MCRSCFAIGFALALVWLCGCGSSKPTGAQTAKVKGSVTLDKKALPAGEVHFGVAGTPPAVIEIKDGNFSGDAPVGKNQVEVYIYVEGPKTEKYGGVTNKVNVAPPKYWGPNTTLSANVEAGGANDFKFDLISK